MSNELQMVTVPVSDLKEDPNNARLHPDRNMAAIKDSLRQFGQVEPLVVRKGTNVVVGGNGRLQAMRELGWKDASIIEVELDDVKAAALGLALNRTSELAEWNYGNLGNILETLVEAEVDLENLGFEPAELEAITANAMWDGMTDPSVLSGKAPSDSKKDEPERIVLVVKDPELYDDVRAELEELAATYAEGLLEVE
jgi:ParB-like chromosome segregation protein Spo0J